MKTQETAAGMAVLLLKRVTASPSAMS